MPRKLSEEKLAALKVELHQHKHSQHLDAGQQQVLSDAVRTLEEQLQAQSPLDPQVLEAKFREWEARMTVEHPVLASVVTDALQKLSAMGI
jgi:RecB family endonuclease NucS